MNKERARSKPFFLRVYEPVGTNVSQDAAIQPEEADSPDPVSPFSGFRHKL